MADAESVLILMIRAIDPGPSFAIRHPSFVLLDMNSLQRPRGFLRVILECRRDLRGKPKIGR